MTTAHRPTWKSAFGLGDSINKGYTPTRSYSARDLPGYLKLKQRQWGQGSIDQLKEKDFKSQLLKRQAQAKMKKQGILIEDKNQAIQYRNQFQLKNSNLKGLKTIKEDQDIDLIEDYQPSVKKKIKRPEDQKGQEILDLGPNPFPEDQDSQQFIKQNEKQKIHHVKRIQQSQQQDDSDSDDDNESQLLREYQKIKQQRQKQQLFKRQKKHQQSMQNRQRQLLKGNPLIDSSYSLSKRWYQDTVFRNQAKKTEEKKSFVNDYVRSDFHRKFMHRFVGR